MIFHPSCHFAWRETHKAKIVTRTHEEPAEPTVVEAKPADCICDWTPQMAHCTESGHAPNCPTHARWYREREADPITWVPVDRSQPMMLCREQGATEESAKREFSLQDEFGDEWFHLDAQQTERFRKIACRYDSLPPWLAPHGAETAMLDVMEHRLDTLAKVALGGGK